MTDTSDNYGEVLTKALLPTVLDPLASTRSMGGDDALPWPIAPTSLLMLYLASPEHNRCIHLIAEGAFGGGIIDRDGNTVAALEDLFEQGTAATFVELGIDLGTYGNAFLQVIRNNATGRIVELRRLPAITMRRRAGGGFIQTVCDVFGNETRTMFAADEVVQLRPPCPMGGFYALPDWVAATGMMDLARSAVAWNAKFFENGAVPEYALIVKGGQLSDSQKQAAREFFRREFRGIDNSHKTLLLSFDNKEVEVDFKRITAEVKDGDFLKMLEMARSTVHLAHGVPPRLLGIMQAGQLGGGSEVTGQFKLFEDLRLTRVRSRTKGQVTPLVRRIGLDPTTLRFRPLDITPADVDRDKLGDWVDRNIITPDEARRLAGVSDETALAKSAESAQAKSADRLAALAALLAES